MAFNSFKFILFFLIVLTCYYAVPKKIKNIVLLLASYYFYYCGGEQYFYVILVVPAVTYLLAREIGKRRESNTLQAKALLVVGIILILAFLFLFKYLNFTIDSLNVLLEKFHLTMTLSNIELLMPLGISFFTLQAVGYLIDVYRGKIKAEKNILNLTIFLSFFGYILSGPIERAQNILPQLKKERKFDYIGFCHGLQLMLWGFFVKLVIAERFGMIADSVFDNYTYYAGVEMFLGTVAYSLQLYCDFSGYSYIARGVGEALGISIIKNFEQPYFSVSVAEFWRRWHISLSSWLRDYLYIPLGGNRKGISRKYINIMIVFLVSGLWHGAAWNFIFWGLLHGFYQVTQGLYDSLKQKITKREQGAKRCFSKNLLLGLWNFLLINFAWIFFRAENVQKAFRMLKRMVLGFHPAISFGGRLTPEYSNIRDFVAGYNLSTTPNYAWLHIGVSMQNLVILLIGFFAVIFVDVLHYKKVQCRNWIDRQQIWFRWALYIGALFIVLILGVYGSTYNASSFIYTNF